MISKKLVYEGKAKKVYQTDNPLELLIEYKDDLTAFNSKKRGSFAGKGALNKEISDLLFLYLNKKGIKTHFIKSLSSTQTLVFNTQVFPIEFVVRNVSAGSISKRLGLAEGIKFNPPIVELYYKNDQLDDPLINDEHALLLANIDRLTLDRSKILALKINRFLIDIFKNVNLDLYDFKIELGLLNNEVILVDEISPDSCRLRDSHTQKILDKDIFRRDLGDIQSAYLEVLHRLKGGEFV